MGIPIQKLFTQGKKLFIQGGPGSGFHGHKGRPGEIGGSASEGGSIDYRKHSRLGVYPSSDKNDPFDAKRIDFHNDAARNFEDKLDDPQKRSIQAYTNGSYSQINRGLRDPEVGYKNMNMGESSYNNLTDRIDNIDSAFDLKESVLPENVILYRGTQLNIEKRSKTIELIKSAKDPSNRVIYEDLGYFSASASSYQAGGFVSNNEETFGIFFEVQTPKGSRVAPIGGSLTTYEDEQEFIFPRGSKFEILHYTEDEEDLPNSAFDAKIIVRLVE